MAKVAIPIHADDHKWGSPDPARWAHFHIKVFPDEPLDIDMPVVTGDGKFIFAISEDIAYLRLHLKRVEAYVTTVSSSGDIKVQLRNLTVPVDMLSTRVQIDAGDFHSKDSGTEAIVNTGNDNVSYGDLLSIDVDEAGTDAWGLGVVLEFS